MLSVIQLHPKVLKSAECGSFFKIGGSRSGPKIDHFQIFPFLDFPAPETRLRQYKFKLCESSHFQTISSPFLPTAKASFSLGPRWGMGVRSPRKRNPEKRASEHARTWRKLSTAQDSSWIPHHYYRGIFSPRFDSKFLGRSFDARCVRPRFSSPFIVGCDCAGKSVTKPSVYDFSTNVQSRLLGSPVISRAITYNEQSQRFLGKIWKWSWSLLLRDA